MNIENALEILGISPDDSERRVKIKFRRMMHKHHPDSASTTEESQKQTEMAQTINEAYTVWKDWYQNEGIGFTSVSPQMKGNCKRGSKPKTERDSFEADGWERNEGAFASRNIYDVYHMDLYDLDDEERRQAEGMYQLIGKGKYFWNPYEEEFSCFLRSMHHLSLQLLKEVQQSVFDVFDKEIFWNEEELMQLRFPYQMQLFGFLADQFVKPLKCLHILEDSVDIDKEGREIFCVRAFAGTKGNGEIYRNIRALKAGDPVYIDGIKDRRIQLSDGKRRSLGEMSLQDDEFYFCIIPLLKQKKAQVKLIVSKTEVRSRPVSVRADLLFYIRITEITEDFTAPNVNEAIQMVLDRYRNAIERKIR